MSTSLETKNRSIDDMLAVLSNVKTFIERTKLEAMIDELVDAADEDQQQNIRELGYDLLAEAASVEDLVVSKNRAIDVMLDMRNSGLLV